MTPPLEHYLQTIETCACGHRHDIQTKHVSIGRGTIGDIITVLSGITGIKRILIIADTHTFAAAGHAVQKIITAHRWPNALTVDTLMLGDNVHADKKELAIITGALNEKQSDMAIAVGSGTINDLVKVAAHASGKPYMCIATAASMDGYLSANATVLTNGSKKAYSNIHPPVAVIADIDIISTAPERMTLAGLGDALGKISSLADWKINHLLLNEHYCAPTTAMLRSEVGPLLTAAGSGSLSEDAFLTLLMRVLLLTGIAMQRMGNSTPASGGEHCVSHAMEMRGLAIHGGTPSLHGLQVAYGLDKALNAYQDLFRSKVCDFTAYDIRSELKNHRDDWTSIGIDLSETIDKKEKLIAEHRGRFDTVRDAITDDDFSFLLSSADAVRALYTRFDLPVTPDALSLSQEDAQFAVRHAVDIRPRLTIFDLHFAAGTIDDYWK